LKDIALGAALAAAMLAATISISLWFPPDQPQRRRATEAESQFGAQLLTDLRPANFRIDLAPCSRRPAWMADR